MEPTWPILFVMELSKCISYLFCTIDERVSNVSINRIAYHTFRRPSIEAEERVVEMGGGSFVSSRILLDNKYYTTELQLWTRESDSTSLPCSATADSRNSPDVLEGVVMVFDLSVSCSMGGEEKRNEGGGESGRHGHLFEAMESGEIASGRSDILLKLCVGTKADMAVDGAELFERRKICMEWCVENGFEYIEVNCLKPWEGMHSHIILQCLCPRKKNEKE